MRIPHRFVTICNRSAGTYARVIHENIETAERIDCRFNCVLTTSDDSQVAGCRDRMLIFSQFFHRRRDRSIRTAVYRDMGTCLEERFRNFEADTSGGARYQDAFIRKVH